MRPNPTAAAAAAATAAAAAAAAGCRAHRTRVGEEGHGHALGHVLAERGLGVGAEVVLELTAHHLADLDELVRLVVGELDVVADT